MAGSAKGPIYAAIAANIAIAISKFIASGISGSSAMLSEGIHSLVDTGNGFLLLFGIRQSKKKPDAEHPLGYGQEVYFWTLVVAILIFAIGGGMSLYEGYTSFFHPEEVGDPTMSYIVLILAMIFEGAALVFAIRSFNKTRRPGKGFWTEVRTSKDPTSFAIIFEDTAALLGLVIALIGVFLSHTLNEPMYDSLASILIGVLLSAVSVILAVESKDLLIGESAFPEVRDSIHKIVEADEAVNKMNPPVTMHMGPQDILVALDVEFKDELSADEIEAAVARIEKAIRADQSSVKRIFIEAKAIAKAKIS